MARPLSETARLKAVNAAAELLAEDGIDGFTMDAVSRRSGVAKTTLYRHWSSGSELLIHAIDCNIDHVPTPDTGSLVGDLLALTEQFREVVVAEDRRQVMLDVLAAAARDPELQEVHRTMLHERTQPIREIVERAVARGEIDPINPEVAAAFVQGPVIARMLMSEQPLEEADLPLLVGLIARGLGAPVD